jgi:hypothetical protein
MSALTGRQLGTLLGKALGLDMHMVTRVTIDCRINAPAMVLIERLVPGTVADDIHHALRRYELKEQDHAKQDTQATQADAGRRA